MNITAKVRRGIRFLCVASVLVVLLVALSACSRTTSPAMSPVGANDSLAQADESMMQAGENEFANAEILSSIEKDGMGIELNSATGSSQMIIRTNGSAIDYTVTRLSSPSRLVLDILNGEQKNNEEFAVAADEFVQRVRVGAHPDKSRVVIDLNEKEGFTYDAEAVGGSLIVRMTSEDSGPMAQPKFEMNDAAEMKKNAPAGPILETFRIEEMGGSENSLIAEMTSAGFFTLEQTAPSEYVLRLEGASFNKNELGTLLAPPKSGAIRSVRVTSEGSDTLLRIFADPAKKLAARTRGSNIIVEEQPFAKGSDIRAQAEIEEVADDAGDIEEDLGEGTDLSELESEVTTLLDEAPKYTGRQISLDLQDTDIDNALRIIAEVSNLNIIASDDVAGKVTLRLIDVPWDQALDVILKTNGLDKVLEGNVMRIAPIEKLRQEREALKQAQEAEEELEPLVVKYVRVSYAKASELRSLVETVLTERGTVAYDERTNQLIIKDIRRGVKNVAELVSRLDLRTPQVLLETQIVEAQRSFLREFGSEIGFSYIASPETGNATGDNFPNSINFGGSVDPSLPGIGSSFPAAVDLSGGSAVSLLLDSADGTRSLDMRLSALEREGRVRIVSRPAVATTNNQQAVIKSVEKIRVKTPSGGLSVATGSGASAAGSGGVATETIEIGIVLEVTPQASPDYFVLLDINAKSSTLGSTVVDGIPSEVERSATSTVLVSSGQTFAMGGIYKITDRDSVDGIPFLKDVPFLGHLFRTQQVDNADEELIFFITPRIVEGSFDDAAMKLSS